MRVHHLIRMKVVVGAILVMLMFPILDFNIPNHEHEIGELHCVPRLELPV